MKSYTALFLLVTLASLTEQQSWTLHGVLQDTLSVLQRQKSNLEEIIRNKESRSSLEVQENKDKNYSDDVKPSISPWSFITDNESTLDNPDVYLTTPAIITRHGYVCETHTVISQGYVISIHRIPHSKKSGDVPKNTVLLQHGLFASSGDWVLNGPDKALAYILADKGYDVWMSNIRGNRYSREHTSLKIDSKTYWDFSWHDVAKHDIPAVIDYILNLKGTGTKITYIGHSMGTTILFAMLTTRPEYNQKLTAGFALAPVVYLSDIKSPIKFLAPVAKTTAYMEMLYKSYEFIPKNSALGKITGTCGEDSTDSSVCRNVAFYICGFNEKQFNKTLLPVFLSHLGTGTSWKTVLHFAQEINAEGKFQQFDYGMNNIDIYGSNTPAEYDLSKITLPISLFWSKNDLLSSEVDVQKLYDTLESSKEMYLVPDPDFNHLDYLWAVDAPILLNNKVLEYLARAFARRPELQSNKHNGFNWDLFSSIRL